MKKLISLQIITLLTIIVIFLTGCVSNSPYSIEKHILLTDAKYVKTYSERVGKIYYTHLVFEKDNVKYDLEVDDTITIELEGEIEQIISTSKMLGTKLVTFDIITDGETIQGITVSQNRK